MKKIRLINLSIILAIFFTSCKDSNNQIVLEDSIKNNIYRNKQLGWKMEIPTNWIIESKTTSKERTKEGYELIESSTGNKQDDTKFINPLAFKKDDFNKFSSTIEKYDIKIHGSWKVNNARLKKIISQTYTNQGFKFDSTKTKHETIDGIKFEFYEFNIYNEKNEVVLNQIMYSQYFKGFDFGINITSNNQTDRELILKHWRDSKFSKK